MLFLAAAVALAVGLPADLDAVLAAPTLHGAHVGVLVASAADGQPIYDRGAANTIQPASTMKLLVGSVALERLGPGYRFATVLTRGDGDALVLHGGGDPLLRRADLDAAADAVQRAGIVRAQFTLDESHVAPGERRAPGWSVDDVLAYYAPVVNGLPFEENVLAVTLAPGAAIGLPPSLQLPPPFVPLDVAAGACRPGPTLLTFSLAARTVAAGRPDTSDVLAGPCGDVVVTGDVPLGQPSHVDAAVDQPEVLALRYFADALQRRGITVLPSLPPAGPIPDVVDAPFTATPTGGVVWRHDGEPLAALLADMWLPSDNLIAEELLREIDVAANAHAGSLAGGTALERTWLRSIGVDPATVTLADGSGLSQYDRFTPRALVAILLHDWRGPGREAVLNALPLAGVRGDLRGSMRGTPAEGHVFAKTGSMQHVRGLAGFVTTRTRGTLVFALSIDDWMGTDAEMAALRAAFCSRLAAS
jgi:D-alanyl-D-alanine carboxypeptidase/D-alanyl-D-alanine-endopeptidase (penicillin-binding protein 4)